MRGVRICIVGSEVANGFVQDTNSNFFAREMFALGLDVLETRVVRDNPEDIRRVWQDYTAHGDVIINSGGLGPTTDDLTVDLLCEWLGTEPEYEPAAEARVREIFSRRPGSRLDVALRQARIPGGTVAIPNPVGLAPGVFVPEMRFFALPGFPMEIRSMWPVVLDRIRSLPLPTSETRIYPVWLVGESQLFAKLPQPEGMEVGVHALPWGCRLFLRSRENQSRVFDQPEAFLRENYSDRISEDPLGEVIQELRKSSRKLAFAESCTGGLLGKIVTDIAGVSDVFMGSAVTYSNHSKQALLGVSEDVLQQSGAVSAECAAAMAAGARRVYDSDIAVSVTGIAGPGGGSEEKPVGTVFIGYSDATVSLTGRFQFPVGRERFRNAAAWTVFLLLYQKLVLSLNQSELLAQFSPMETSG